MKRSDALLGVVFMAAALACAPVEVQADETIRIGCWNIEHLDTGSQQKPEELADYIQLANVDLLALEEIHDTVDGDSGITNDKLDATLALINTRTGQDWKYVLYPDRTGVTRDQHTGVAWNAKRLTIEGSPFFIPVTYDNAETWKRTPHATKFSVGSGKTDFAVITLHMKSNNNVAGLPAPRKIRELEANALVAQLDGVTTALGGEKDIALLGDLNCLKADEPALAAYKQAGFTDLNSADSATYRDFFQQTERLSPFDRILVKTSQPEFAESRQYILAPADRRNHVERLSDHFMAIATVRVQADDD